MKTNSEYNKLLGALIGLVRATEGNEDLVNETTDSLIIEALQLDEENSAPDEIESLIEQITAEKKRLVPNCFACLASCGKTNNYDMQELYNAPKDVRETKQTILANLKRIADRVKDQTTLPAEIWETIYNAIFYLGLDLGKNDLLSMVAETENAIFKLREV